MSYWTCSGSVRGGCGVRHRTEEAAAQHCRDDDRAVKRGHGTAAYSDRHPVEMDTPPDPRADILDQLRGLHQQVLDADQYAADARARRDAAIRGAVGAGITMYRIAQATGLSEGRLSKICKVRRGG